MKWTLEDIQKADRTTRLLIMNSAAGIKPANLIGTRSKAGNLNLAIFSSVVHLGSNPPLIGFVMRPTGEVPRHTYENIIETSKYTINAIPQHLVENAHFTSAKFETEESEFEWCDIDDENLHGFPAPFVKSSPIKLGLHLEELSPIKSNGTNLVVGKVEQLIIEEDIIESNGYLNLEKANLAGIGGLNTYYSLKEIARFPYARREQIPQFR